MVENNGFKLFLDESKEIGSSYMNFINERSQKSALDKLTNELVYISALTALKTNDGLAFHVQLVKELGATREQIRSRGWTGLSIIPRGRVSCLYVSGDSLTDSEVVY
jgi:hypothetical protein